MTVPERPGVCGETALRLGKPFGTGAHLWMTLREPFDLQGAPLSNVRALEAVGRSAA